MEDVSNQASDKPGERIYPIQPRLEELLELVVWYQNTSETVGNEENERVHWIKCQLRVLLIGDE